LDNSHPTKRKLTAGGSSLDADTHDSPAPPPRGLRLPASGN